MTLRSVVSSIGNQTQENVSILRSLLADASMSFRESLRTYNPDVLNLLTVIIGLPISDSRRLMHGLNLDNVSSVIRLSHLDYENFVQSPGNHRLRFVNYFDEIVTFKNWVIQNGNQPSEYTAYIHALLRAGQGHQLANQVINTRGQISPTSSLRSRSASPHSARYRSKSPSPKSVQFTDKAFPSDESTIPKEGTQLPNKTESKPKESLKVDTLVDSVETDRMADLNRRIAELEVINTPTPSATASVTATVPAPPVIPEQPKARSRSSSRGRSRSTHRSSSRSRHRRKSSSSSDSRGGSDYSSSDSESDSSDEEDENRYSVQKFRPFKLEPYQHANTKIPLPPINYTKLKHWENPVHNQFEAHGLLRLILKDKEKRALKPAWPKDAKRSRKSRKYRNYRKDLRAWERDSKNLKLALLEMGLNHYLLENIRAQEDGVKAFDYIMQSIDPGEINIENELATKLKLISGLTLTSISSGSFSRFHAKFETMLAEATNLGAPEYTDAMKKAMLIGKLDHAEYKQAKLPSATDPYKYKEYVLNLNKYASMTEEPDNNKSHQEGSKYRTKRTINTTKKIGGHEVNERGAISNDVWENLTSDERTKFIAARNKHYNNEKSGDKEKNKSKTDKDEESKSKDRKIRKLEAKVKTLTNVDESSTEDSTETPKSSKTTKDKSYAEALAGANKQAKALAMKILNNNQRKVKQARTVRIDTRFIKNNTSTREECIATIDGGADTCFHGRGFKFIEFGERKANVVGCNDDVQDNLNIGTSITAVKDIDGETVILLTNEAIENQKSNSMFSSNQLRHFGVIVDDTPKRFGGQQWMKLGEDCIIPFAFKEGLVTLEVREPNEKDLKESPIYVISSDGIWNPNEMSDDTINPDSTPPIGWDVSKNTRHDKRTNDEPLRALIAERLNQNHNVYSVENKTSEITFHPQKDISEAFLQVEYEQDNKLDDLFDSEDSSDEEMVFDLDREPFGADHNSSVFADLTEGHTVIDTWDEPGDTEDESFTTDENCDQSDNDSTSDYDPHWDSNDDESDVNMPELIIRDDDSYYNSDSDSDDSMPQLLTREDDYDSSDDESDDDSTKRKNTASVYSSDDESSTFSNNSTPLKQGGNDFNSDNDDDISIKSIEVILEKFRKHRRAKINEHKSTNRTNVNPNTENADHMAKFEGKKWKVDGNDMTKWVLDNLSHDMDDDYSKYGPSVSAAHTGDVLDFINQCSRINNLNMRNKPRAKFTIDWDRARRCLGYFPLDVIKKTFECTTQFAKEDSRLPLRRHWKSRFPGLNKPRLHEKYATDTWFSSTPGINGGHTCCQMFVGTKSEFTIPYAMTSESEGPSAFSDFIRSWGAPHGIHRDNSQMQTGLAWKKLCQTYNIEDMTTEPHHPHQNPAERRIKTVKNGVNRIMDRTATPKFMWFYCTAFFCCLLNVIANPRHNGISCQEVATGIRPDISPYLHYEWWEPVYYLEYDGPSFPESKELLGRWAGPAENCGDLLTYNIYDPQKKRMLIRSCIRSARNDKGEANKRAINPNHDDDNLLGVIREEVPDNEDIPIELETQGIDLQEIISLNETVSEAIGHNVCPETPEPNTLLGYTFPETREGIDMRGEVLHVDVEADTATIEFADGTQELRNYTLLLDRFNRLDLDDDVFTFSEIGGHRMSKKRKGGAWEVLVIWDGPHDATWEPLSSMKVSDPITLAHYAHSQSLIGTQGWKWAKNITKHPSKLIRLAKVFKKARKTKSQYEFGVKVPGSVVEAMQLDKANGNTLWKDAIEKEMGAIMDLNTFNILEKGEKAPPGHVRVPLNMIFTVKHDLRRKARLVAGGHVTAPPSDYVYSGVVANDSVRTVVFLTEQNGLKTYLTDIGNAFITAETKEKIWAVAGPEFGPDIQGRVLVFVKALYGLKSASSSFHHALSDILRDMGWKASKADPDVWMKDFGDHYEYICRYVDDLLLGMADPQAFMGELRKHYTLKDIGTPDVYLGADYHRIKGDFTESGSTTTMGAKTYLKNVCAKIEELLGPLRNYSYPMDEKYHPELDETAFLGDNDISKYRMLTGSGQWAITLGRIDVLYAISQFSRYNMAPREGHLKAMLRVFGYLKNHLRAKIIFDTNPLDIGDAEFLDEGDWSEMYPDSKEELPPDMPNPKMKPVDITIYYDASFADDLITRKSTTGLILFLNSTPVKWLSKRQNTIETSTYGAELVAGRMATEWAIEYRYKLRMLGIPINGPVTLLGDNKSAITSTSVATSVLKKKHNAIAYHRIREAHATGIVISGHVRTENNFADIATKALPGNKLYSLCKPLLFKSQSDSGE
jgi:hypothetical protein